MIELVKKAFNYSKRTAIISNQSEHTFDQLLSKSESIASCILDGQEDLLGGRVVFFIPPSFKYVAI